jgi:hypothetical protein
MLFVQSYQTKIPSGLLAAESAVMFITLNVPEELATRLRQHEDELPRILELGLRDLDATAPPGFAGVADVLEMLARLPTPEEILALRPSATLQARIQTLLEKNRTEGLSPVEEQEWEQYQYLEHVVRLAKARAHLRLKTS